MHIRLVTVNIPAACNMLIVHPYPCSQPRLRRSYVMLSENPFQLTTIIFSNHFWKNCQVDSGRYLTLPFICSWNDNWVACLYIFWTFIDSWYIHFVSLYFSTGKRCYSGCTGFIVFLLSCCYNSRRLQLAKWYTRCCLCCMQ